MPVPGPRTWAPSRIVRHAISLKVRVHLQLEDAGLVKGASPPDDQHVETAVSKSLQLLGY